MAISFNMGNRVKDISCWRSTTKSNIPESGDVDSVELFDDFRPLKSSLFDDFRALKFNTLLEDFMALKSSFFDDFRALKSSLFDYFRALKF